MYAPTETFSAHPFSTCHPSRVKRGLIKGEAVRLHGTKQRSITNFKTHLLERGYPENLIQTTLLEVTFQDRNQALRQKKEESLALCNEQLAFYKTATIAKQHFQGAAPNIAQKRAFPYAHENKPLERLKHARRSHADTKKRIKF